MGWFSLKRAPEMVKMEETEDYVCVSIPEAHMYYIVNKVTTHGEYEGEQLPTTLYQMQSLQGALSKLKEEGKYSG
jgi:hypothetical protein